MAEVGLGGGGKEEEEEEEEEEEPRSVRLAVGDSGRVGGGEEEVREMVEMEVRDGLFVRFWEAAGLSVGTGAKGSGSESKGLTSPVSSSLDASWMVELRPRDSIAFWRRLWPCF